MIAKNCVPHENTYLQRKQQDHLHENTQKKKDAGLKRSLFQSDTFFIKVQKCANDPCHPQMAGAVCVIVWGAHAPWYHKAASGSIIKLRSRAFGNPRRSP